MRANPSLSQLAHLAKQQGIDFARVILTPGHYRTRTYLLHKTQRLK